MEGGQQCSNPSCLTSLGMNWKHREKKEKDSIGHGHEITKTSKQKPEVKNCTGN